MPVTGNPLPDLRPALSSDIRSLKVQRLTCRVGGRVSRQLAEPWPRGPGETPKIAQVFPRSLWARSASGGSAPELLLSLACYLAMCSPHTGHSGTLSQEWTCQRQDQTSLRGLTSGAALSVSS